MRRTGLSLEQQCRALGLPEPVRELRFAPPRRWRFDYAWVAQKLALEQEGGGWTRGRHTRGAGYVKDMSKYNAATLAGWRVLRATPQQVANGEAVSWIEQALTKERRA